MCCEQLLCAACGGRVSEARCATCAVSRAHVHDGARWTLTPELAVLLLAIVGLVTVALRATG